MSWARLDDGFHDHPKVDDCSLAAIGLYTLCLTWAHRHRKTALMPGHITEARVRKVAGAKAAALAGELEKARLWEAEAGLGGWVIHDFCDYLPKERDPSERREAGRKGAAKRWESDSKLPSNSMANDGSCASAPASPSRPVPSRMTTPPTTTSLAPLEDADPPKQATRGTRLAPNWQLPDTWGQWAISEGLTVEQVRREAAKFGDFWHAKAGRDATKADWAATWRTWVRRFLDDSRAGPAKASTTTSRVQAALDVAADLRRQGR